MIYNLHRYLLILATAVYIFSLEEVNAFTFHRPRFLAPSLKPTLPHACKRFQINRHTTLHMSTQAEIDAENEQIMTEWLDDMIYSGDMVYSIITHTARTSQFILT